MTAFEKAESLATERYDRDRLLGLVDEVTANLPDRSRPARWRLSGSRGPCVERKN